MAGLPHNEVAGALYKVGTRAVRTSTKLAVEFLIPLAARSGEVRLATRDEIDLAAAVWTVSAERMSEPRTPRAAVRPRCGDRERRRDPRPTETDCWSRALAGRRSLSDMTLSRLVKEQSIATVFARLPVELPGTGFVGRRESAGRESPRFEGAPRVGVGGMESLEVPLSRCRSSGAHRWPGSTPRGQLPPPDSDGDLYG